MSSILIIYGSETGTAEDIAESLSREARLQDIPVRLVGFDEYDVDILPLEVLTIFVVATTGQGEFPPNMRAAWRRLLRKNLSIKWLSGTRIAVLGLGDSSYQKYNFAGKKLFRRLLQLGAEAIVDLGLADDQHELGIDGALTPWRKSLWCAISRLELFEVMNTDFDPTKQLPSKYHLNFDKEMFREKDYNSNQDYEELAVIANLRVTADNHFQDTRLIRFCIKQNPLFKYNPGDVLMIRPYNLVESIETALKALQYDNIVLDSPFVIKPNDPHIKLPPTWLIGVPTTLRICFTKLFDLQMVPRKSFFETLGSISTSRVEKEKLLELASPQGLDDLLDYSNRCRRTVAETLQDFPETSAAIPPERLFDLFSMIRPRAFSIASSMQAHPDVIELLVAKVEYKTRMREPRRGLCSTFMARLKIGDKVFTRIRAGTFKFPSQEEPVICVGPGTGVAPFRSYLTWRERTLLPTPSLLFFGCRGRFRDFYFCDEWENLRATRVFTAFSRDLEEKKTYVQHVMKEHSDDVWNIIGLKGGSLFIAGSSGDMPKDVATALNQIAQKNGWADDQLFVDKLEKMGKIQFETWS